MPEARTYTATRDSSVVEGTPFPKAKRRVLGQKKRRPVIIVLDAKEPGELRELPGRPTCARPTIGPVPR